MQKHISIAGYKLSSRFTQPNGACELGGSGHRNTHANASLCAAQSPPAGTASAEPHEAAEAALGPLLMRPSAMASSAATSALSCSAFDVATASPRVNPSDFFIRFASCVSPSALAWSVMDGSKQLVFTSMGAWTPARVGISIAYNAKICLLTLR